MSQQYISAAVVVTVGVLGLFGKTVDSQSLTSFISSVVIVVSGVWIMVRRFRSGDINILGGRKY